LGGRATLVAAISFALDRGADKGPSLW
jgi:hypothetical protein